MNADNGNLANKTNQPNELDIRPNVSNDPSTRLPKATKGCIQDILRDNQQVEVKRRINHKQALLGNTHNLKTGKYSRLLPPYLLDHLSYIDELQFVGSEDIQEIVIRLLKSNMKRVALAEYREIEGQTLDPYLSKLIRDTYVMAMSFYQTQGLLQAEQKNELDLRGLNNEQLEAIDELVISLRTLCEPDEPETITVIPS